MLVSVIILYNLKYTWNMKKVALREPGIPHMPCWDDLKYHMCHVEKTWHITYISYVPKFVLYEKCYWFVSNRSHEDGTHGMTVYHIYELNLKFGVYQSLMSLLLLGFLNCFLLVKDFIDLQYWPLNTHEGHSNFELFFSGMVLFWETTIHPLAT